jgi:hypothetical protein
VDYGDLETTKDSVNYVGPISFDAKVPSKQGTPVTLGYSLDIMASMPWDWEHDETPTGWNHAKDSPTYSTSTYASGGDVQFRSLTFTPDSMMTINGDDVSMDEARQVIDPIIFRQLLNPDLYTQILLPMFERQIDGLEPDEDYDEPERDERY